MVTYTESGVDVELGNDVSKILYNAARATWKNRSGKLGEVIVPTDNFSGLRYMDVSGLPEGTVMNMGFDGIGTAIYVAEGTKNHRTMGFNLLSMVCDDVPVRGGEPVLVGSILDVQSLGPKDAPYLDEVKQLAEGYINAARAADVAIVNGEVAELGARINGYGDRIKYNWGAGVVWFANKKRLFTGKEIKVGDSLVGFYEKGFRSNGWSLVRRIMEKSHGEDWYNLPWGIGAETMGEIMLIPPQIYCKAIVDMTGGWDLKKQPKVEVHGVAHITGGGIPEKLERILEPSGLGAEINNPFAPSSVLNYVLQKGEVKDREAYRTLCFNTGMIIITPEPEKIKEIAEYHQIRAQTIGVITKEPGIKIKNMARGSHLEPWLIFN